LGFPLLADPAGKIGALYGMRGLFSPPRVTFVIDTHGIIRARFQSWLDVVGHVDGSLAAVERLATRPGPRSP
jgi:peroxiredoxin